uniref:Putative secreted protein n=1 Tax=Ixodes ricinus TaxID=34613 RepID=A0A6B0U9S8_IXORI
MVTRFWRGLMCLSYGRLPQVWAALFTSQVMLRVKQYRVREHTRNEYHRDSPQKYQGTRAGSKKQVSTISGM